MNLMRPGIAAIRVAGLGNKEEKLIFSEPMALCCWAARLLLLNLIPY